LVSLGLSKAASEVVGLVIAVIIPPVAGVLFARSNAKEMMPGSRRQRLGHLLLLIGNALAISTTVVPAAVGFLTGNAKYGMYVYWFMPVMMVNLILWPLGWSFATKAKNPEP
jgi:hypothetical protein